MPRAPTRRRQRGHGCGEPGVVDAPAVLTRKIPPYELLDEEALVELEDHAEWLLSEIGIVF